MVTVNRPAYRPELCAEINSKLGYLAWHAKAQRDMRRGVRQAMCARCGRWKYPDERCTLFSLSTYGEKDELDAVDAP
jgi:hypothetical protein